MFTAATYTSETFKNLAGKKGHIASVQFTDCKFVKCQFAEAVFEQCQFESCVFDDCDLALARLPKTAFSDTEFNKTKLIGINWTETQLAKPNLLTKQTLSFTDCVLNYGIFLGLNLQGIKLVKCVAREVNFEEANLTKANCQGTDFAASRFVRTNLTEADFTKATNYAINVNANTLRKTKFSMPEAMALLYGLDIVLVE